jgi:hypothetical protein
VRDVAAARDYYEAKASRPIGRIVACGGSSLMPGLVEHLSEKLSSTARKTRIERADPWLGLELDPLLEKLNLRDRGVLATTAVGLALRGLGVRKFADIDLLSAGTGRHQTAQRPMPSPAAAHPLAGGHHLPVWLKLAVAVAGVLLVAVGAWFAAFRLRAPKAPSAPAPAASAPANVDLEVAAAVGDAFAVEPPTLPVVPIEVEAESRVTVERQGEERVGYAKGTVEIVNDGASAQTLIATTRFLSEGGVVFRLDARVVVPARGRASATFTADQSGPSGDVPAGRFTIPGLPAATQRLVYGVTSEPTRGGLETVGAPFTEDDLASLRGLFEAEASGALEEAASAKAGEGRIVLVDAFEILEVRLVEAPTVGAPTGAFTARAVVRASVLSADADEAAALLLAQAPSGGYRLGEIEAAYDTAGTEPSIRLRAVATLGE